MSLDPSMPISFSFWLRVTCGTSGKESDFLFIPIMEAISDWCREWLTVYQYMFTASVRARSIAMLSMEASLHQTVGCSSSSSKVAHERSLSTKQLLFTSAMEDRSMAYQRVFRLCSRPRLAGVSATVVVQHLLDMSLRWWIHWFCGEVNRACGGCVFPVGCFDTAAGVYEHPAWKGCETIFHDIEVDVAFRTALRNVLTDVESNVMNGSPVRENHSYNVTPTNIAIIHAFSTLSRHCLFLERVLYVQFLTLNCSSDGVVAKILRRAVRDMLERPYSEAHVPGEREDVLSLIKIALVACAQSITAESQESMSMCPIHQCTLSGNVSLIFTLIDSCGLAPSLNDTCSDIEALCYSAGALSTKKAIRDAISSSMSLMPSASVYPTDGVELILVLSSRCLSSIFRERVKLGCRVASLFRCSATTMFTAKAAELSIARLRTCLSKFHFGSTEGSLDDMKRFIELFVARLVSAFASHMLHASDSREQPQDGSSEEAQEDGSSCNVTTAWVHAWQTFADPSASSEMATIVESFPARYCLPGLIKLCCSNRHIFDALQVAIVDAVRLFLGQHVLVANDRSDAVAARTAPVEGVDSTRVDVVKLSAFVTKCRCTIPELVPCPSGGSRTVQSFLDGVIQFLRAHESKAVCSLVGEFQHLISVDGVREGACPPDMLEALGTVVSLLPSKDVFVDRYAEWMGKRLLGLHASGLWSSESSTGDLEWDVVSALSARVGATTCASLTAILRDFQSNPDSTPALSTEVPQVKVVELCAVRWKSFVRQDLLYLSTSWKEPQQFLEYQLHKTAALHEASRRTMRRVHLQQSTDVGGASSPQRLLQWALCSGSITLHCYFPNAISGFAEIVVQCPPYVALVVDAVGACLKDGATRLVPLGDVCAMSSLPAPIVRSVVVSLAAVGVLRRNQDCSACGLLDTSPSRLRRMRVNPATTTTHGASTKASSNTTEAISLERQRKVEACIVRAMKSSRQLAHLTLFTMCVHILAPQFEVTPVLFKNAVAEMITREFLKRVEVTEVHEGAGPQQQTGYEYVA